MNDFCTSHQLTAIVLVLLFLFILFKKCKDEEEKQNSKVWKYLPVIALSVGLTALCFQITVLYPWHNDLSQSLQKISNKLGI